MNRAAPLANSLTTMRTRANRADWPDRAPHRAPTMKSRTTAQLNVTPPRRELDRFAATCFHAKECHDGLLGD